MAVRRESVLLDLEVRGTKDVLGAAGAVKTLEGSLRDLDGTTADVGDTTEQSTKATEKSTKSTKEYNLAAAIADERTKRLKTSLREQARAALDAEAGISALSKDTDSLSRSAVEGSRAIDRHASKMGTLLRVAATLGPALIPIGAVGIQGVAGLANQFGFAAVAAGTAVAAFQGVGDALTAVNKAALDPTVKNLQAAHDALKLLSPAGRSLIGQLQELKPILTSLRDTAAEGLFPGVIEGLESLERLAPGLDAILSTVSETLGDLFAAGADSLASSRWADFFAVIALNARPVLTDLASAIGSVVHGLSEMWEAFMPLNRDFGSWMADAARSFDQWATGLSETKGFQDFVAYIRENGPKVADAAAAIGDAFVQIVQAGAPLGGPILSALTGIAEAIATIVDSPLGTPIMAAVTAMSALSIATNIATAATLRLKAAQATLAIPGSKGGKGAAPAAPGGGLPIIGGSLPQIAIVAGLLDTVPDYIENLQMMANGERDVVEGMARMAAGATPLGAGLNLLGVDVLGVDEATQGAALGMSRWDRAMQLIYPTVEETSRAHLRLDGAMFRTNRTMLRTARQSARVEKALKGQREAAREAAAAWGDYSAKVKVAAGPDVETLTRRWDRIGEAATNMSENIRDALENGIEPRIIKDVIDTLGPQGAALALQQFADATGGEAERIEASFRSMGRGTRDFRSSYDALSGVINGDGLSLDPSGVVDGAQRGKQSIVELSNGVSGAMLGLRTLDKQKPEPVADLDIDPLRTGVASAEQLLFGLDGDTAHTYVYTHLRTVRDGGDTAGGPPELRPGAADGGTVPGRRFPYGDSVLMPVAPTEEITGNRYGQADHFRAVLKEINAWRPGRPDPLRSRMSERPMSRSSAPVVHVAPSSTDLAPLERRLISLEQTVRAIGAAQVEAVDRQTQSTVASAGRVARRVKGGW